MNKSIALGALVLALLPGLGGAQGSPAKAQAILAYADDESLVVITDAKGTPLIASEGMVLPVGTVVKTLKTSAEIQLKPNGTIIKLSASTTFKIEGLRDAGAGTNDFAVLGGKIRAVAAKLTGEASAPGYNIRTPTANCGVRGTDFAMKYDPDNNLDWVCVQEGQVDFTSALTGATVPVAAGQFANTFDANFGPAPVDAARIAQLFADLDFVRLDPRSVPTSEVAPVTQKAAEPVPAPAPSAEKPAPAPEPAPENPIIEFLRKFFGLEVGSVTIDSTTYSKAVLSPVVAFDGFKLGLYLPIVYTRDMFDTNDWYRPLGNNEWSFGSDKSSLADKLGDAAADLVLKIKFLEWGNQGDPFYLKVGNLRTMSLGHGTVVRNFANDQDFPAVRKVGVNAGAKIDGLTFEGLVDDLASVSLVGGRVALNAVGDQIVVGFQAAADLHLAEDKDVKNDPRYSGYGFTASNLGDPILLVGGVDLQLFRVDEGPAFRTRAFADVNTLALYNRRGNPSLDIDQGFVTKTIWHDNQLGSVGGEAGFTGNLAVVDYRLSFQAERGLYRNALFQGNYYRTRDRLLAAVLDYTTGSTASATDKDLRLGVYGSAGFDLGGVVRLDGAYKYPLVLRNTGTLGFDGNNDYARVKVEVPKDKIPFTSLSGSVSYERTKFIETLVNRGDLLDAYTVVKAEVVYGLAKGLDLALGLSTSALRNLDGTLVYQNGLPKVGPTITIDTRVTF